MRHTHVALVGKSHILILLLLIPLAGITQVLNDTKNAKGNPTPPFSGTIFIDPDIITSADSSTFLSTSYAGQASRRMYDRRVNGWITVNAFLFNTSFNDGLSTEIQVNPEFENSATAMVEAQKYGWVIGQLPTALRRDVKTVWIHKGDNPFGGGNNNLLIHTEQARKYEQDGILEETFVHEAAHTSLDQDHASTTAWRAAQTADGNFISTYARDNPTREDIAESFLPYLAVRFRPDRISESLKETIVNTIPNRMSYFDNQSLNMYPIVISTSSDEFPVTFHSDGKSMLFQNYPNPFNPSTIISYFIPESDHVYLKIYDALGKEIETVVDEFQYANTYSVDYSPTELPSGIYLYQLQVGSNFMETRKMKLIR